MVFMAIVLADGVQAIAKPDALTRLETYFTLRAEDADPIGDLEWRYARFISDMHKDPSQGWVWTAKNARLDLDQLNDEDGKWIDLANMLPYLLHAAQLAVKGPYPLHFKLLPLMNTGDPTRSEIVSDIVDGECIVTMRVVGSTGVGGGTT